MSDGYPLNMQEERDLTRLRELFPELEITREWWGWLAYPKGVHPVVFSTFPEGIESQILRLRADA